VVQDSYGSAVVLKSDVALIVVHKSQIADDSAPGQMSDLVIDESPKFSP
jgi:hypothetical protein